MSRFGYEEELKRKIFINKLLDAGIRTNKSGISIHDLDYKELRHEAVMVDYRNHNVESSENAWF